MITGLREGLGMAAMPQPHRGEIWCGCTTNAMRGGPTLLAGVGPSPETMFGPKGLAVELLCEL